MTNIFKVGFLVLLNVLLLYFVTNDLVLIMFYTSLLEQHASDNKVGLTDDADVCSKHCLSADFLIIIQKFNEALICGRSNNPDNLSHRL